MLHYTKVYVLTVDKHISLLGHSYVAKKMKCWEYNPWDYIYNNSFSSWFTNDLKRLQCYNTLIYMCLPWINTSVYWAIQKLQRKWSVENTTPGFNQPKTQAQLKGLVGQDWTDGLTKRTKLKVNIFTALEWLSNATLGPRHSAEWHLLEWLKIQWYSVKCYTREWWKILSTWTKQHPA